MPVITNIAAYKFANLTDLKQLRERLLGLCKGWNLKGTILLSQEGINLFIAGGATEIEALLTELRTLPGLEDLTPKYSPSDHQPFNRMLVRLKKEIISFGVEGINPANRTSPKLKPAELKQWIDEGKPITLLDTRNDYEYKLGTFKNALTLDIDHFRQFPDAVRNLPAEMKQQPVVMFCTGGIRCEKAGPFMELEGFEQIYQLDGGILKYFEDCGSEHYDGECFVFDQRVGVDPALQETDSVICFSCQAPLTTEEREDERYSPPHSCPYCFRTSDEKKAEILAASQVRVREVSSPLPGSTPSVNYRPLNIPALHDGVSLIDALCGIFPHIGREEWLRVTEQGQFLNAKFEPISGSHIVRGGERYLRQEQNVIEPEINTNIRLIYEDEAIVVLDKPAPLPIHASGRFNRNTLHHLLNLAFAPRKLRAAHRLDANTTGVLVCTKSRHFAKLLQPQFEHGEVEKVYLAQVQGLPEADTFTCNLPISDTPGVAGSRDIDEANGQSAITEFRVISRDNADGTSLLEVRPLTGRTHQIRVHLWHLGLPISGDPIYLTGKQTGSTQTLSLDAPPLHLHAWKLSFIHPLLKERVTYETPLPDWATQAQA